MKHIYKPVLMMLILLFSFGVTQAQQAVPQNTANEAIMRYIDALNIQDYQTAYALLNPDNQSFADYVAGYANTERIVPYFGRGGAAAGSVYITTVLLGYQTDGTVKTYYGYYRLANGGNFSPPIDGYVLRGATFKLIKEGTAPQNGTIAALVDAEWDENAVLPPEIESVSQMSTDEADTILDYYDLINARDFATAYAQWLNPTQHGLARDYRLSYNQFVTGYNDTVAVTVYAGQVQGIPANQQHTYLNSYLPTVLVGQHSNGTFVTYYGCYALGDLTATEQGIVNGRFYVLANTVPDVDTIFNALNSLNCASLGMGI